jgi:tetraacyldisaccharide 4'-kinase
MSESGASPELRLRRVWQGEGGPWLRGALSIAAGAYRGALTARDTCYAAGIFSTRRLRVPVISIGNLTLGGSGKTPLTALVAAALAELGTSPAILSRGYGRRTRGVRVVADRDGVRLSTSEAGDEPRLLAEQLPGIPVVVGESRYEAGRVAVERCGAHALVLDDGFQHRTLAKDLEILAVPGTAPWGNGRLFPRGILREPMSALRRVQVAVVTNPPHETTAKTIAESLRRQGSPAIVLTGTYHVHALRRGTDGTALPPQALAGRRVVALAGLASPAGFVATLSSLGAIVAELEEFPDHHPYTEADLGRVRASARRAGAECVVTTEKDWMRLREGPRSALDLWALSVRLDMGEDRTALVEALAEALRRKATERATS